MNSYTGDMQNNRTKKSKASKGGYPDYPGTWTIEPRTGRKETEVDKVRRGR